MRPSVRVALGFALGLLIAWAIDFGVALAPTRLPAPEAVEFDAGRRPEGSGVRISFVTTGTARVPARRLHHGAGLGRRDVVFRAALIEHPEGTVLFGTGVDPDGPSGPVYDPFGRVRAVDPPAELPEIDRVVLPTPRWLHMGGLERWPQLAEARAQLGGGDLWQIRSGPWPRRYGMERARFERVADRLDGIRWTNRSRLGMSRTADVFGDGNVVLVALRGSTIDEVGVLVTLDSGRQFLLVGDLVWTVEQVRELFPRPPWSTWLLDRNRMQLAGTQTQLYRLLNNHGVATIPLLDGALELPEYPERWE